MRSGRRRQSVAAADGVIVRAIALRPGIMGISANEGWQRQRSDVRRSPERQSSALVLVLRYTEYVGGGSQSPPLTGDLIRRLYSALASWRCAVHGTRANSGSRRRSDAPRSPERQSSALVLVLRYTEFVGGSSQSPPLTGDLIRRLRSALASWRCAVHGTSASSGSRRRSDAPRFARPSELRTRAGVAIHGIRQRRQSVAAADG